MDRVRGTGQIVLVEAGQVTFLRAFRSCLGCLVLVIAAGQDMRAGEFNPVLDIGDQAPVWKDLPGVDGKQHSLVDLKTADVVVVVFTCNTCPYAVDYEQRLVEFDRLYRDQNVRLVAINVNRIEDDLLPAMKQRARERKFRFPYLHDESQQIARDYGAGYTPEFFVLNRDRKVVYMGSMDDNADAAKVKIRYVQLAVEAARANRLPEKTETVAVGCRVRFERRRRKPR